MCIIILFQKLHIEIGLLREKIFFFLIIQGISYPANPGAFDLKSEGHLIKREDFHLQANEYCANAVQLMGPLGCFSIIGIGWMERTLYLKGLHIKSLTFDLTALNFNSPLILNSFEN